MRAIDVPLSPRPAPTLTPLQEAEQARQVVNVLTRMERRFLEGHWASGHRFAPRGGTCLLGAIDEATGLVLPGVADRVLAALVDGLPRPLRLLAKAAPKLAIMLYNDTVGGRNGALRLVREARYALGGLPLATDAGDGTRAPWTSGRIGAAPRVVERVIDLTDGADRVRGH